MLKSRAAAILLVMAACAPSALAQKWSSWSAIGPFDQSGGPTKIAQSLPVELQLREMKPRGEGPDFTRIYRRKDGTVLRWVPLIGAQAEATQVDVGVLDFSKVLAAPPEMAAWTENAAVYLYRSIESSGERTVSFNYGSDDGLRIWFNSKLVVDAPGVRPLKVEDNMAIIELQPGANHLLVKVVNEKGPWLFQTRLWEHLPQAAVDNAIDKGVAYLLERQLLDGSWNYQRAYGSGYTSFALYTLLKCGLPPKHPAVQRSIEYIRTHAAPYTYTAACDVLALCATHDPKHREWIEERLAALYDWQEHSGLFAYPVHPGGGMLPQDLSNTLYVALAFRAADQIGIEVPSRIWRKLAEGTLLCFDKHRASRVTRTGAGGTADPAGFSYRPYGGVTGSMTTAGLGILAACHDGLGAAIKPALSTRILHAERAGLSWIDHNLDWTKNPPKAGHHYFFVYGVERVGVLLKRVIMAGVDWYWDGAAYLIEKQKPNGAWASGHEPVDTLLALLFLKRASAAPTSGEKRDPTGNRYVTADADAPMRLRASGDTPLTFWLESFSDKELERLTWPGETGMGPHIESVVYTAEPITPAGETILLRTVLGQSDRPMRDQRFSWRGELPRNGKWKLHAKVTVLLPPEDDGLPPVETVITGHALEVNIDEVITAEQLAYGGDSTRNVMVGVTVRGTDSSKAGNRKPELCGDGLFGTSWKCEAKQAEPWVKLELSRPVLSNVLLISHALPQSMHASRARPKRVRIEINHKDYGELLMDPDIMIKTIFKLEKPLRVRAIKLTILECYDRPNNQASVGFSEIELQYHQE